jgi:rare lipoprotein A
MHRRLLRPLVWICLGAWSFAGSAAAQAPIVYAGGSLAGGGEASYGYGAPPPDRDAPALDVSRGAGAAAPAATPGLTEQGTERPAWLEQERVGPPYEVSGRWYVPTVEPGYEQVGTASWYGADFHGRRTASGEVFDQDALTAAHPTLPIPSLVQVTNLQNGREVIVRVNDRGPFVRSRLIDVSRAAADALGFASAGHARVHVRYLGPAPRRVAADALEAAPLAEPEELEPAPTPAVAGPGADLAGAPGEDARTPAGGYVVQVGAFADLANAHRVRQAAAAAGPVTVDVRATASGELFRVRVGPWSTREQAEAALRTLAALGYADAIVAAP